MPWPLRTNIPVTAVLCALLSAGCDDDENELPTGPEESGLVIDNASTYELSEILVRTCGAKPWSTELSDTSQTTSGTARTLDLANGCYDIVAVTREDEQVLHRHAPNLQIAEAEATRVTLETGEFQPADSSVACAATGSDVESAIYFVGEFIVMDQMLEPLAHAEMQQEFQYQLAFWGVPTAFYGLLDSQGPNAIASPEGWIAFGDYLYQIHGALHGAAALWSSLAHEFGHRVQHTTSRFNNDPRYGGTQLIGELEADAFAGYYMAHPAGKNANQADMENMASHFYEFGTTEFYWTNPGWHGTKYQRYASNYVGASTAYYEAQNGLRYTYQDLHELWMTVIINEILVNPNPAMSRTAPRLSPKMQEVYSSLPHQKIRDMARGRW